MPEVKPARTFFVIAPPGLEAIVHQEFAAWFTDISCGALEKGGFEFIAPLELGCAANLVLKTPTRILLRLADFGCRDFPKLFKKIRGFDWSPYLQLGGGCRVDASTHGSRLKIKKRIEETVVDGMRAAGFAQSAATDQDPAVYVRFFDDVCFISLDTSGGILHKRGDRTETPEAPLRESFAAALLWALAAGAAAAGPHSADARPRVTLVDPMMGSGTFLTEAKQLAKCASSREFGFSMWPVLKDIDARAIAMALQAPALASTYQVAVGYERDADTAQIARRRLGVESVIEADFFASPPRADADPHAGPRDKTNPVWLICNPPYGRRLKVNEPLTAYYGRLLQTCEEKIRPDRAGFIIPQTAHMDRIKRPRGWRLDAKWPFSNGGIAVTFYTFTRETK